MASNLRVDTILPSSGLTLGIGTANGTVNFLGNCDITTQGDITITGNLGVGGTITYEDVARVDATGISTFREGFKLGPLTGIALTAYKDGSIRTTGIITASSFVGSGANLTGISQVGGATGVDFNDTVKARWGSDNDLEIVHSGSAATIKNTVGNLNITNTGNNTIVNSDNITFQSGDQGETIARFLDDSACELWFDNTKRFETYSNGTLSTGNMKCTGSAYIGNQIDGHDGNSTGQLFFGASNDLKMYHDGTDATIKNITGDLKIENLGGTSDDILMSANDDFVLKVAASETAITASANGGVALYYNDARTCYTINNGLTFDDNKILKFGSSGDVQVFYDGTNYYTYAANEGHIKTQFHSANGSWEVETTAGEHRIQCPSSGTATSVRLFWNGSPKLDTQSSGVYVTGSVSESSDIALKENIQPLSNSLANLKQLNGYSYKFKDTEKETGVKSLGLTAQEVEKVYPDLVQGEEGSKSLQYSGLIAPLLEAIKELSTEVEALKTKVAALES